MDEPGSGNHDSKSLRGLAEEALLAGVGAVALTKDRADELVQELAGRGKMTGDDARELVDDVMGRWRGDAVRMSERAGSTLSTVFRELGPHHPARVRGARAPPGAGRASAAPRREEGPVSSRPAVRQLGRLSEISQVAAKHGFGYFFDTHRPHGPRSRRAREVDVSADGSNRGLRVRQMLDELGPTFVKFGQLLSTRPDIVPPDIVFELKALQDDVTPGRLLPRSSA